MQTNGFAVAELSRERVDAFLAFQRAGGRNRSQWSRPGLPGRDRPTDALIAFLESL